MGTHNKTYSISYYENRAINFFLAVYDRNGNKRSLLLALNVFLFWNQNSSFVEIFPFFVISGVIKTAFKLDIAEWYNSKHEIHGSWYVHTPIVLGMSYTAFSKPWHTSKWTNLLHPLTTLCPITQHNSYHGKFPQQLSMSGLKFLPFWIIKNIENYEVNAN